MCRISFSLDYTWLESPENGTQFMAVTNNHYFVEAHKNRKEPVVWLWRKITSAYIEQRFQVPFPLFYFSLPALFLYVTQVAILSTRCTVGGGKRFKKKVFSKKGGNTCKVVHFARSSILVTLVTKAILTLQSPCVTMETAPVRFTRKHSDTRKDLH